MKKTGRGFVERTLAWAATQAPSGVSKKSSFGYEPSDWCRLLVNSKDTIAYIYSIQSGADQQRTIYLPRFCMLSFDDSQPRWAR
jgi:hypothetical protein